MTAPRKPAAFRIEPEAERDRPSAPQPHAAKPPPRASTGRRPSSCRPRSMSSTKPDTVAARSAAADRAEAALLACADLSRRVRRARLAGRRPLDRPAHPRPVRSAPSGWAGWRPRHGGARRARACSSSWSARCWRWPGWPSVEKLRRRALDAIARDDPKAARAVVAELSHFVAAKPETAAGRRALAELDGEIIDGANLIRLAETEMLAPLDAAAKHDDPRRRQARFAGHRRQPARAGRYRLCRLRGGPADPPPVGTLRRPARHAGFFRLARSVLAHLAVTGAIAAGDSFVQQIVGQACRAAFGQARRRRRQRHDDGAHRHRGDGDGAAPALHRPEAPGNGAISCRHWPPSPAKRHGETHVRQLI